MEQNINAQHTMNEPNASPEKTTFVVGILPTAEIIEHNDYLFARINELLAEDDPDTEKLYAYIDEQCDLHSAYDFSDQVFEENGKKGVIDIKGNIRIPAIYTGFDMLNDYWYYMNPESKDYAVCAYDEHHKCALVAPDGKGTPLTPFVYDRISNEVNSDEYMTFLGEKCGLLDSQGNILVACEMDEVCETCNGIRQFKLGDKYGLNTDSGLVIEPIYDDMTTRESLLYVRLGDKWGYIDTIGQFIEESDVESLKEKGLLNFYLHTI